MSRFCATCWYQMDIDIENFRCVIGRTESRQLSQAGFFLSLLPGHGQNIGVTISMPARLKPAIEFPVMNQDHLRSIGLGRVLGHNPGRPRNVPYRK